MDALNLLDEADAADHEDSLALTALANMVIYAEGFLESFVSGQAPAKDAPFMVNRMALAALLIQAQFDAWQGYASICFIRTDNLHHEHIALQNLCPLGLAMSQVQDARCLRIVDLGLECAGFSTLTPPLSHSYADAQTLRLDIKRTVEFMRSARCMSWEEPGWLTPDSLTQMRKLIS